MKLPELTATRGASAMALLALIGAGLLTCGVCAIALILTSREQWALPGLVVGAMLVGHAALGLGCVSHLLPQGARRTASTGLISAASASVAWFFVVTNLSHGSADELTRFAAAMSVVALVSVISGLHLVLPAPTVGLKTLRWIPVVSGVLFASLWSGLMALGGAVESVLGPGLVWVAFSFMVGGAGIMLVSSVLVPMAIRGAERRERRVGESVAVAAQLTMECPDCCHEQSFSLGAARCKACGFTMTIDLEEPRCVCGFLLYRLEGNRCPECGRAVQSQ